LLTPCGQNCPPPCFGRTHFIFSHHSPETQADAFELPVIETGLRIRRIILAETCGSPPSPTRLLAPFLKARRTTPRNPPHAGNETPGPQVQIPHRTARL